MTRAPAGVGVDVRPFNELSPKERALIDLAQLGSEAPVEAWCVSGTNRQLAYATHGVFRYFGKFPAPLARRLIDEFTGAGDWVLDPMAGSGTTAVEALDARRHVVVSDVSPLSTMLCRVKTRHVPEAASRAALARVQARFAGEAPSELPRPVGLLNADHWFLPETMASLGRLKCAITPEPDEALRELLLTAFASAVRRVSKATTQQGRLFLDVATAKADAWPTFEERLTKYAAAVASLSLPATQCVIEQHDAKGCPVSDRRFQLAIMHPPYFNNYKYSAINSLELAWLGVPPKGFRTAEIRESFKVGKPEKVAAYVDDLAASVAAVAAQVTPGGTLALMMGDTTIRQTYLDVTRQLLRAIAPTCGLTLDKVVLRVPRYTEASWVASQRRRGDIVGVTLNDFILLLSKSGRAE